MPTISEDLFSKAKTIDITGNIDPLDKRLHRDIKARCNCGYQSAALAGDTEQQTTMVGSKTGGTMDLTFTLEDLQTFDVTGLAFDANASTLQVAIDDAALLAVAGYTVGDIVVTGGPFASTSICVTFSGESVRGNHPLIIVDGTNLTGDNEIQSGTIGDQTAGTMDFTFLLEDTQTFDVTGIDWDSTASALQTAIDSAASGVITGYTNGDISVTGGPFASGGAATVITFDGASVQGNHDLIVVDSSNLTLIGQEQTLTPGNHTSGTMDFTFTLEDSQTFDILLVDWDTTASALQTVVDSAAASSISGYVAGDIDVTGGPLGFGGANTIVTFSGASVQGNHPRIFIDKTNLPNIDEVQLITPGDKTGGTFKLTFRMEQDGEDFDVLDIDSNVTASALQSLIDAVANSVIVGWTNGDIAVTGGPFGPFGGADTTFTFVGSSVQGNHQLILLDGTNLTGGSTLPFVSAVTDGTVSQRVVETTPGDSPPVFSETTPGSAPPVFIEANAGGVPRFWFAALKALGVITGTDPAFGAVPNGQYTVIPRDSVENYPSNDIIRSLLQEANVGEGQDWVTEIFPLTGQKI